MAITTNDFLLCWEGNPKMERDFWSRCDLNGPFAAHLTTRCWVWIGAIHQGTGYGVMKVSRRQLRAHRVSYRNLVGEIPMGLLILHSCDNRTCVNPGHLRPGTHLENKADSVGRGRHKFTRVMGEQNGMSRITEGDVIEIRRLRSELGLLHKDIAEMFGISRQHVSDIINRKRWADV